MHSKLKETDITEWNYESFCPTSWSENYKKLGGSNPTKCRLASRDIFRQCFSPDGSITTSIQALADAGARCANALQLFHRIFRSLVMTGSLVVAQHLQRAIRKVYLEFPHAAGQGRPIRTKHFQTYEDFKISKLVQTPMSRFPFYQVERSMKIWRHLLALSYCSHIPNSSQTGPRWCAPLSLWGYFSRVVTCAFQRLTRLNKNNLSEAHENAVRGCDLKVFQRWPPCFTMLLCSDLRNPFICQSANLQPNKKPSVITDQVRLFRKVHVATSASPWLKNDKAGCYEISSSGKCSFFPCSLRNLEETCMFFRFVVAQKRKLSRLLECKHHRKNLLDGFGHDLIILLNSDPTFHTIHWLHC